MGISSHTIWFVSNAVTNVININLTAAAKCCDEPNNDEWNSMETKQKQFINNIPSVVQRDKWKVNEYTHTIESYSNRSFISNAIIWMFRGKDNGVHFGCSRFGYSAQFIVKAHKIINGEIWLQMKLLWFTPFVDFVSFRSSDWDGRARTRFNHSCPNIGSHVRIKWIYWTKVKWQFAESILNLMHVKRYYYWTECNKFIHLWVSYESNDAAPESMGAEICFCTCCSPFQLDLKLVRMRKHKLFAHVDTIPEFGPLSAGDIGRLQNQAADKIHRHECGPQEPEYLFPLIYASKSYRLVPVTLSMHSLKVVSIQSGWLFL